MADYNRVLLIGRLTRDPQLRYLPSQSAVCDFGLATGRKFKTADGQDREETTFVDCSVFGKGAEIFNQYCQKGKLVFLEGRLKLDQWDDKQTGQKRSKLSVVVENFQFLGGRNEQGSPDGGGDYSGGGDAPRSGPPSGGRQFNRGGGYASGDAPRGGGGGNRPGGSRPPPRQSDDAPPPNDPPFDDAQQFKDDDIPF